MLHVRAQPQSPLRDPAQHQVIGKAVPRVDIPAKVTGGLAYVQDLRLAGMVHGRVVPPPGPGAKLVSLDTDRAQRMPGVLKILRDGNFVAVIAEREWRSRPRIAGRISCTRRSARPVRWRSARATR